MHPEVKSDKPGKCPRCGMALVKKAGPAPAGKKGSGGKKDSASMKGMKM
ncbi:heavy metal-binding domain-containing protein [Puia sp. P3]